MGRVHLSRWFLATLPVLFGLASSSVETASAGQVIKYTQSAYMSTVNGITIHNPYTNANQNVWVGPVNAQLTNGYGTSDTFNFRTYCIDLLRNVSVPSGNLDVANSLMVGGAYSFEGTSNGVDRMGAARAAYLYATYNPLVSTVEQGVALQLALWSAIYNGEVTTGDFGLSQGDSVTQQFWVSNIGIYGSALNLARQYLEDSLGMAGNADFWYSPSNFPGTVQWQLGGPDGTFEIQAVPEPSTLVLGGLGGLFFLAYSRRRRPTPA